MEGIIYKWQNKINNKTYIGQTIHPKKRYNQHKNGERADKQYIDRAIKKYGVENFDYNVIDRLTANTKEELREKLDRQEIHYISLYGSHISKNGYNITLGGLSRGNFQHTQDTKDLLSRMRKGKKLNESTKKAISEGHKGLILSKEHKEKLKESHKGDQIPILQLTIEGKEVAKFESIKEASRVTGINRGGISACINNKQQTTTGKDNIKYTWRKL